MNQKMGSRNTAIGILTALLVAALILVSIICWKHLTTKDALQASEKKLLHLNENLIPSKNAKIADLQKKLEKEKAANEARLAQLKAKYDADLSQIEELKTTREKIVELNKMLYARDQTVSQLEEKLESLEGAFEEEKKIRNALSVELSSKDALAASLQKERGRNQSNIAYLEEEMAKGRSEIQRLHEQLSALRGDKEIAFMDGQKQEVITVKMDVQTVDGLTGHSGRNCPICGFPNVVRNYRTATRSWLRLLWKPLLSCPTIPDRLNRLSTMYKPC